MNAKFQTVSTPTADQVSAKEPEDSKLTLLLEKIATLEAKVAKQTVPAPSEAPEHDSEAEDDGPEHEHITTPDGHTVSYLQWLTHGS